MFTGFGVIMLQVLGLGVGSRAIIQNKLDKG